MFVLPGGLKQEPPNSNIWIPKSRSKPGSRFVARLGGSAHGTRERVRQDLPDPPFWRACPVCNVLAEVTADLLES